MQQNSAGMMSLKNSGLVDRKNSYEFNSGKELFQLRENSVIVVEESEFRYNESNDGLIDAMFASLLILRSKFEHNLSHQSSG